MGTWTQWLYYLEITTLVTGLTYLVLSLRQNPWCWPIGIVSVSCWLVVVFYGKLYLDAFLQLVYIILGFYGWYQWRRGNHGSPLKVRRIRTREVAALTVFFVVATPVCGYTAHTIGADMGYLDAITTTLSLMAQLLLTRKVLETWLLWFVANGMYIYIYYTKGWDSLTLLMSIYTVLAAVGWWSWRKDHLSELLKPRNG